MADLPFRTMLAWQGRPADGGGRCTFGQESVRYSAPAEMGGPGAGANPETLLLAAVGSCFSITLARILATAALPFSGIAVEAEGLVTGFPHATRFAAIVVHPRIGGADPARGGEYVGAAQRARDQCFIGTTVRDSLDYRVGAVSLEDGTDGHRDPP